MIKLILAIPADLAGDLWWTYPLALVSVIVICGVLLALLKRVKPEKEANKLVKKAIRYLKRAVKGKVRTGFNTGFNILTAKNLIKSATYYYSGLVKDKEIYRFRAKIEVLDEVIAEMGSFGEVDENGDGPNLEKKLPDIVNKLSAIVD
jgi:phage gp36-like protein